MNDKKITFLKDFDVEIEITQFVTRESDSVCEDCFTCKNFDCEIGSHMKKSYGIDYDIVGA